MTFDRGDIRPSMDVYTKDNAYLGTVLAIVPGERATARQAVEGSHAIGHALEGSKVSGELLGPVPTQMAGNSGPIKQAAAVNYASAPDNAPKLGEGSIVVGKWYGLLGRRTFALDVVQTVSLERVVLRLAKDEL